MRPPDLGLARYKLSREIAKALGIREAQEFGAAGEWRKGREGPRERRNENKRVTRWMLLTCRVTPIYHCLFHTQRTCVRRM